MKKILIGIVALVFLLLIIGGMLALRFESRWAAKIASLRASGHPASIAELKPAPAPNGQNAAAVLAAVASQVEAFGREQEQFYKTPAGQAFQQASENGDEPTAEQTAAMRLIVERYPDIAAAVAKAAALDKFQFDLDYSLPSSAFIDEMLKRHQRFRAVGRHVAWRIRLSTLDGDSDVAVRQGIELLKLSRLEDQAPTIVSHLISIAVHGVAVKELSFALASGSPSAQSRAALEAELALHDSLQPLGDSLVTERAFALSSIEQLGGPAHPVASRFLLWKPKSDFLAAVDHFDALLPVVTRPWHELGKTPGERAIFSPQGLGPLADNFIPATSAAYDASNRRVALSRCLRVLNAMQAFADANGRNAHGLHELKLPVDATIDPFSGAPLIVKHTDRGWVVYSVYRDGKDDGGEIRNFTKDAGIGPPQAAEETAEEPVAE
jgi:hypothetical protein